MQFAARQRDEVAQLPGESVFPVRFGPCRYGRPPKGRAAPFRWPEIAHHRMRIAIRRGHASRPALDVVRNHALQALTQIKKGIRPEQRYLTAGGTDWAAARNPA